MEAIPGERLRPGTELPTVERAVTRAQVEAYAEATGDDNPLHLDDDFARAAGLPGAICHGMLEMAMVAEAVISWTGPDMRPLELSCRFSRPLLVGDSLRCGARIESVDSDAATLTLDLTATSGSGERVLSRARAVVATRTAA